MSQAAENRVDVLVVRGRHKRQGKLLYWSSKHDRAKVLLPSGAVITVATDTVALLNGENIVADEIDVDTKYRNFRGLQPDTSGPNTPNTVVSTMGGAVASTQPRLGCETHVENHVA